jgi:hypothetical protein
VVLDDADAARLQCLLADRGLARGGG